MCQEILALYVFAMVDIIVEEIYSTVQTKDMSAVGVVRGVCRARPKGFQFMKKYKQKRWDGYISLMYGRSKFPTGLLDIVVAELDSHGYDVNVIPEYKTFQPSDVQEDMLSGITLREYQIDAVRRLLASGRGIAKMATNSGKTEIMAAMIKAMYDSISRATVVLHRKELLHQTVKRIEERTGLSVGMIGDGIWEPAKVTVAMIQTLYANSDKVEIFADNDMLLLDECHNASSDQMMDILPNIPGSMRYGFSGTPLKNQKLPDMKLTGITGSVVCEVANSEMIEMGYSAKPKIVLHTIVSDELISKKDIQWMDAVQRFIVDCEERNDLIANISKDSSGTILVLVNRVEHGNILHDMIDGSTFVTGSHSMEDRMAVLDAMRSGDGGVFIATPIYDEGVDVPSIDVLVLAGGGKDQVKLLQRVGRGLRIGEEKDVLIVHDFIDDTAEVLLLHSLSRVKTYEQEGFDQEFAESETKIGERIRESS